MIRLSRTSSFAAGAVLAISALAASSAIAGPESTSTDLLRAPMQGSQLSDLPLFGQTRGGAPWVITSGEAKLATDGTLKVAVVGLIIPTSGINPLPGISASVACNGTIVAHTATAPFSRAGDAEIKATVNLPERCLAPAVLLNPNASTTAYIAATGH